MKSVRNIWMVPYKKIMKQKGFALAECNNCGCSQDFPEKVEPMQKLEYSSHYGQTDLNNMSCAMHQFQILFRPSRGSKKNKLALNKNWNPLTQEIGVTS